MDFTPAISGLGWVLAGAIPPAIFLLYFLKLRRKSVVVPSTYLWKKSVEDLRVNSLWQKLRQSILLLLQILFTLWLILALLGPSMKSSTTGEHVILLIDHSASMSASDVKADRLTTAKQKAIEVIDAMKSGDAGMVIATSDRARVYASYTQNKAELRKAVESIPQSMHRTNIRDAISIASGLANPQRTGEEDAPAVPAKLFLFSDGKFPVEADLSLGNLDLTYVSIGKNTNNVAILALAIRPIDNQPDRWQVFTRIKNFREFPTKVTAELYVDSTKLDIQQLDIKSREEAPLVFRLSSKESSSIEVRLTDEDDFSADNRAWASANPPKRLNVIVVGPDNPVLRAVLETPAAQKIASFQFQPESYAEGDLANLVQAGTVDLVIFDRVTPKSMPNCNSFMIDSLPSDLSKLERKEHEAPVILNWKSEHPLLRFLALDDVSVSKSFSADFPSGSDMLIESDSGPLLVSIPRGIYTDVIQTFRLVDSDNAWRTDWPVRLSFPLFMMNVLRTLGGAEIEISPRIGPGQPIVVPVAGKSAVLTKPDGATVNLVRSSRGVFEFLDTDQLGPYTVKIGDLTLRYAVNLMDDLESDIVPAGKVNLGYTEAADASSEIRSSRELWRWLAVLGLAFLMIEWYVYNRRVRI